MTTTTQNIGQHLKNIFEEGELDENSVVKKFFTTAADGKDYNTAFYNLDAIISVGYRVKSSVATRFRIWATARLREYIVKGFALNDELLKQAGGGSYFDEPLSNGAHEYNHSAMRDQISSAESVWTRDRHILNICR